MARVRSVRWKPAVMAGLLLLAAGCASPPGPATEAVHIVYLHGRIVQDQGPGAVSPEYGRYEFDGIVEALGANGARVHAPIRARDATVDSAAADLVALVQQLERDGIAPGRITVVGASHGSVIAMRAATLLADPRMSWVLMGACDDWTFGTLRPQLHGRVLSVFEHGDRWGGSCRPLAAQPGVRAFEEIGLRTGLGHGFLYRPLPEWVVPALAWAQGGGAGS